MIFFPFVYRQPRMSYTRLTAGILDDRRLSSLSVCTHLISSRWSCVLSLSREEVQTPDSHIMTLLMLIRGSKEADDKTYVSDVITRSVSKHTAVTIKTSI